MSVSEFIDQWYKESVQEHGFASNDGLTEKAVLYLKDWHFVKVPVIIPTDYVTSNGYICP